MIETKSPKKRRSCLLWAVLGIIGAVAVCAIIGSLLPDSEPSETVQPVVQASPQAPADTGQPESEPTETPAPTDEPAPTETPLPPTSTPEPSATPEPTAPPEPVFIEGTGQTATDIIELPAPVCVAHFTHSGSRNFIVEVWRGEESDLLINHIGPYDGARPLFEGPIALDINADGAWSVLIEAVSFTDTPTFSGTGDAVSPMFDPPPLGVWEIKHNGERNFIVYSHCAGGSNLLQNEIGLVNASMRIPFGNGPCMWEVRADGEWSLAPKE